MQDASDTVCSQGRLHDAFPCFQFHVKTILEAMFTVWHVERKLLRNCYNTTVTGQVPSLAVTFCRILAETTTVLVFTHVMDDLVLPYHHIGT